MYYSITHLWHKCTLLHQRYVNNTGWGLTEQTALIERAGPGSAQSVFLTPVLCGQVFSYSCLVMQQEKHSIFLFVCLARQVLLEALEGY